MKVKSESEVPQSCPTLSDPMDRSLPGSSIHGFSRQEHWRGVLSPSPQGGGGRGREKAVAPHSSTLAWKIPWMEEPGRLQSIGVTEGRTRLSDFTFTFHFHALEKEMAPHSSVLAWRIPGMGEPGGLPSMGSHRVGHD